MKIKERTMNKKMILYLYILFINVVCMGFSEKIFKKLNTVDVELCYENESIFKLEEFSFEPHEPIKGQNVTVKIKGNLLENIISGSKLIVDVKFQSFKLLSKTLDICDELKNNDDINIKCPIEKGQKELVNSFTIPKEVPSGNYYINLLLKNGDDKKYFVHV